MTSMTTPESPSKDQVRILVVDDHPNTAAMLARALTQLGSGVDVISATSGHEALEKVKTHGVDILFTDMIMPEMTGLELIEKMQNHPAGRPAYTYLVTAYDVPGLKVTAHRLKVNEVVVKPVRPERICQIATNAIEEMKHSTRPVKYVALGKKKFKILVADDRPDNITLLTRYLEYEGYENITARDGLETLDKVRDELPDLVLLDVNMPHKDGFAVLEEIRNDPAVRHIPVIILTAARLDSSDVQSGLNLGADDYVTKPFDRHELMARIHTKLRVKEAEDVIRRRNRELNLLPEIGKELSARTDVKDLAYILLKRTVETLGAIQGNMVILGPANERQQNYQVSPSAESVGIEMIVPEKLLAHIIETHQGLVIGNARNDPLWQADQQDASILSAVITPLHGRKELIGLLILTHEQENYFTMDNLLLLQAIASQAAIAIENARLYSNVAKEQQRLSAVLQSAANPILMFDADDCLKLLNPAGEKLFTNYDMHLNMPLARKLGYDALIELLDQVNDTNKPKTGELTWPDKRTFTVLLTPIEGGGCVVVLQDVTHFKDVERVKNEFIATASHDLKNPLTSIVGYSQMLIQLGSLSDTQTDFVNRIQHAGKNMNELVQNMLSLAQVDLNAAQKYAPVDLGTLLATVADEFSIQASAKEQTFAFIPLQENVKVNGDSLQLKQLFRNLIGNAIKYTPEGGRVTITAQVKNENVQVEMQDTGFGIPAADLPFIFNRFYRVREGKSNEIEGNGLGLAIAKSIAEQHSGQISVESEVNKGTRFSVSLPFLVDLESGLLESEQIAHAK